MNSFIRNIVFYRFLLFYCLTILSFSCKKESVNSTSSIIPQPNNEKVFSGEFILSEETLILIGDDNQQFIAEFLQKGIENHFGKSIPIVKNKKNKTGNISLMLLHNFEENNEEAYHLKIKKNKVEIQAKDLHGLFYGVQSFLQLIPNQQNMPLAIPCLSISDLPELPMRGIHFDVVNHFFSVEYIKKMIDVLAMYKMNTLILHLIDDAGWRIEIKKYPKLTEVGAWREDRRDENWRTNPGQRKPYPEGKPYYGGYYTQEEIKEIVNYASDRFVTIIPEVDFPGRLQSLLAVYPELSCTGEEREVASGVTWGHTDPLCLGNDSTSVFIKNVLSEIFDLFPSEYVFLGAAESFTEDAWKNCEKCQNKIKLLDLKNEAELNENFIKEIAAYVTSNGKKIIGTNIYSGFNTDIKPVILNWMSEEECLNIVNNTDLQVLNMYRGAAFSNYQAFPDDEPQAFMPVSLLFDTYRSNYIPLGITKEKEEKVLGGVGGLWTMFIQTPEMLEYMLLPRLCALSESLWTRKEKQIWEHFLTKLTNHYIILDKLGYNYYIPSPEGAADDIIFKGEYKKIWLSAPIENAQIRYTLDDTEPTMESDLYSTPIPISSSCVLRTKTFLPSGKFSTTKVARYAEDPIKQGIVDPVNIYPGLKYQYYKGGFTSVNDFLKSTPTSSGVMKSISLPEVEFGESYGINYSGLIVINQEGVFTFYLRSDDGSRLYIDDYLLIDYDGIHGAGTKLGRIGLLKGFHKIRLEYFNYNLLDSLILQVDGPGLKKSVLSGDYLYYQK